MHILLIYAVLLCACVCLCVCVYVGACACVYDLACTWIVFIIPVMGALGLETAALLVRHKLLLLGSIQHMEGGTLSGVVHLATQITE